MTDTEFIGWIKRGAGAWHAVTGGHAYFDVLDVLLDRYVSYDKCVLPCGTDANDKRFQAVTSRRSVGSAGDGGLFGSFGVHGAPGERFNL